MDINTTHYVYREFQERFPFYVANIFIPWNTATRDSRTIKEWAAIYVPFKRRFLLHDPNMPTETEIVQQNRGNYFAALLIPDMEEYASREDELYDGYRFLKAQYEARKDIMDNIAEETARLNNMEWKRE